MNKKILIGIGILILIGFMFMFGKPTGDVVSNKMIDYDNAIKIPLAEIDGTAQFFEYDGIEFFVIRAKDGSVRTAFNACDVCYRSKKGYRQEGDDMVCNNCGNHYKISGLGTANMKGGGCWPGYLEANVDDKYMIIAKSSLEAGRYRF